MLYYIIYVMLYMNSVKYITDVFQEHQGAAARERERERERTCLRESSRARATDVLRPGRCSPANMCGTHSEPLKLGFKNGHGPREL
jgi:hypothetical protein